MKKQTTEEKTWSETLVEVLEKRGYDKAISDVEKIVDRFAFPVTMGWDRKENINEVSKSRKELKQEIAKLKSGDK